MTCSPPERHAFTPPCLTITRPLPLSPLIPHRAVLLEYYLTIGEEGGGPEEAARLRARAKDALVALGATEEELGALAEAEAEAKAAGAGAGAGGTAAAAAAAGKEVRMGLSGVELAGRELPQPITVFDPCPPVPHTFPHLLAFFHTALSRCCALTGHGAGRGARASSRQQEGRRRPGHRQGQGGRGDGGGAEWKAGRQQQVGVPLPLGLSYACQLHNGWPSVWLVGLGRHNNTSIALHIVLAPVRSQG